MSNSMRDGNGVSWWHTLPGILTAVGGLIGAIAALVVALHNAGLLDLNSSEEAAVFISDDAPNNTERKTENSPNEPETITELFDYWDKEYQ